MWWSFIIGLIVGGTLGVMIMAVIAAGRDEEKHITLNYCELSPEHQGMVRDLINDTKKEVEE